MEYQYEDELPATMADAEYNAWFAKSRVVDGVRVGPTGDGWDFCPNNRCWRKAGHEGECRDLPELMFGEKENPADETEQAMAGRAGG